MNMTLGQIMWLTEEEYFLSGESEYAFDVLRKALAQLWCDPWEACRQKAKEYLEQAQKLGHTGVLPEKEKFAFILPGSHSWGMARAAVAERRQHP
jgi:hypothetical protein